MPAIRILLADDQPIVRVGLMSLLKGLADQVIFLEADDERSVVTLAKKHRPNIALIDLSLAGIFTLELIKTLRKQVPDTNILVVAGQDEMHYAERFMKAGARGYAMKHSNSHTLLQAAQTVHRGQIWLSENFRNRLVDRMVDGKSNDSSAGLAILSDRELTVFRMIGSGLRKAEIARELNLSPNTVETYRSHIKQKLGVSNGADLNRLAFLQFQDHCF